MFDFNIPLSEYITGDKFKALDCDSIKFFKVDDCNNAASVNSKAKVIITHNGDYGIDNSKSYLLPPQVKRWYAQNLSVNDNRFYPVPIGMENDDRGGAAQKKQWIFNNKHNTAPEHLLFLGCLGGLDDTERFNLRKKYSQLDWVFDPARCSYDEFYSYILNSWFVISPPGFGIDCHRTWEALYLGRIPIVQDIYRTELFDGLPVIFVKNFNEVTKEFLEEKKSMYDKQYNFDKLKMSYWIKKIEDDSR